jgi:isopentenyl diphosphate isomerase/L-lactate dehydrogenase-like FMN-dependent dehydrogenase
MDLTELYQKGEKLLRQRDIGVFLDGVETGFVLSNNRRVLDQYTFRQCCIDAGEADISCNVLGVKLSTPVIMSAITTPIPSIVDNGLAEVALALKEVGSLMWTGSVIPKNLKEIVQSGVPVAANVKPFEDRTKVFSALDDFQEAGVTWVGIEIDAALGTKIGDKPRATGCAPLSMKELQAIRKRVSGALIFKGVLSRTDAMKSVDAGADGIVVSNHGGHTIDYLPHPLQVMDEIVSEVDGRVAIMVDGGFRRGSDVLKGLAFGACLVSVGRPILYGLAADGKRGVKDVVNGISQELKRIMTLVGAPALDRVRRDILIEG